MFSFRESLDPDPATGGRRVEVAFTDAAIDVKEGSAGLEDALGQLASATGATPLRLEQVHGDSVHVLGEPGGSGGAPPVADAVVTTRAGVALMVRAADCVPVLLADASGGVIGAVHAGRQGVALDVVTRAVERMRAMGAADLRAWIGPHVCGGCYEVPAAMREEVATLVPAAAAETTWGTPALDLGAAVAAQLAAAGVPAERAGGCTREDERLHSYRRDGGAAGRLAGLVWMP